MTWYDCKLITLQKMFSADSGSITEDDTTAAYRNGMPAAANEAFLLLAAAGIFCKKKLELTQSSTEQGYEKYDLKTLCSDFHSLVENEIYLTDETGIHRTNGYFLENGNILILNKGKVGTWDIWYNAYPQTITQATPNETELASDPEVLMLLPLYMASALFKDDDLSLSVQYRNEFEAGKDAVLQSQKRKTSKNALNFVSVTGWV
jgi:hypothetical protein